MPSFFRRKTPYIVLAVVAAGIGIYAYSNAKSRRIEYETAPVEKRDLLQTVEVTGSVKPLARIELAFKTGGTLKTKPYKIGDAVKTGDVLAELEDDDLKFALANAKVALEIAQTNLTARLAGEPSQSIRVAETQLEQAEATYKKAVSDLESAKQTSAGSVEISEIARNTARHNYDNRTTGASQTLQNSKDNARSTLIAALGPLQTALTDGDQITGVDNAGNQLYVNVLGALDPASVDRAKYSYTAAKQAKLAAEQEVKALGADPNRDAILSVGDKLLTALNLTQGFLTDVQKLLAATLTSNFLTLADLNAKKAVIDADRISVSNQESTVLQASQAMKNAEQNQTQIEHELQDAMDTAWMNLELAKANASSQIAAAQANVSIQKAGVSSAKAALDLKKSAPREVDVAALRASVKQAEVALAKAANDLEKTKIASPIDGTVSEILPEIGELVTAGTPAVKLVGLTQYDIEALVPEADIAKIQIGQTAVITLDAYGDEVKFQGALASLEPDQTKSQDAVYYRINMQIDPAGREIKPGMTANVTIRTGERQGVLIIPIRAVKTAEDGGKTVRTFDGKTAQTKTVQLGLRGDEGKIEVMEGLTEGEKVIVGESAAK